MRRPWRLKILALCPEHPKRDQNPKFTPLSETTSIPVCFIWESSPHHPGMKNSYTGPQEHWTRLGNINIWVKFRSRNSEVFKIYTKYPSFLVYNQVFNLFVCTLCPCLTSVLKWNWDKPLRNSLWLDMTLVTWKSRLRLDCVKWTWHNSDYFWFASQKKKHL